MKILPCTLLSLFLAASAALPLPAAPDPAPAAPLLSRIQPTPIPHFAPEDRPAAARQALDSTLDRDTRITVTAALAHSGYCPESAAALATLAADPDVYFMIRDQAALGLLDFTDSLPPATRQAIQKKLRAAMQKEQELLPRVIIQVLLRWGDANLLHETFGLKLRSLHMGIEILTAVRPREAARAALREWAAIVPPGNSGWHLRFDIGSALISLHDTQGIDLLIECLATKEHWPPIADRSSMRHAIPYSQCMHEAFDPLARLFDDNFGYEGPNTWNPQFAEAIPRMIDWWKAHRNTWTFEEATSTTLPAVRPGQPLTKRQARILAARLATDAFASKTFQRPKGQPPGPVSIAPESFNDVRLEKGRWILRMIVSSGPEASVEFASDGTAPKVTVHYALSPASSNPSRPTGLPPASSPSLPLKMSQRS